MDASLEWCSTPPLWHTKAVGGGVHPIRPGASLCHARKGRAVARPNPQRPMKRCILMVTRVSPSPMASAASLKVGIILFAASFAQSIRLSRDAKDLVELAIAVEVVEGDHGVVTRRDVLEHKLHGSGDGRPAGAEGAPVLAEALVAESDTDIALARLDVLDSHENRLDTSFG